MQDFTIKDEFNDPRTVSLKVLREEVAAGNPWAALLDVWVRLGGYERGLEDPEYKVGYQEARKALAAFLDDYVEFEHEAYSLLVAVLRLLEGNDTTTGTEPERIAKVMREITSATVGAVIERAERGSYNGKIVASMLVWRGINTDHTIDKAREFIEQLPGLSDEPPTSNDPMALMELSEIYAAMIRNTSAGYPAADRERFMRRHSSALEVAAELRNRYAMERVADYFLQQPPEIFRSDVTDQAVRLERAMRLYTLCIKQGDEETKTDLANMHVALGDIETEEAKKHSNYEEAKRLFRERLDAGDTKPLFPLIELLHRLKEHRETNELLPRLWVSTGGNNSLLLKAATYIYSYHTGEGMPGVEKSDVNALMASEAMLDLNRVGELDFNPGKKTEIEAVSRSLWSRAWIRDEKQGLRRARRMVRPLPLPREREALYLKRYSVWQNHPDDPIGKPQNFVVLPEDPKKALAFLFTEAQTAETISSDLASELIKHAQVWVRDPAEGLRLAVQSEDILQHQMAHVFLQEEPGEGLPVLQAEADQAGAIISVSLAFTLARLNAEVGNDDEARRWQLAAAERGSAPDIRALTTRFHDEGPEQDWVAALQLARHVLAIRPNAGGLKGRERTDIEKIERGILRADPPRVWIPDADGFLRPITKDDKDVGAAVFVAGDADAVLAWCVEDGGKGSPHAAQVAIRQFAARGQTNQVWFSDAALGYLRPFAANDDVAQAVFVPRDPEQAAAFLAARAAETEVRENRSLITRHYEEGPEQDWATVLILIDGLFEIDPKDYALDAADRARIEQIKQDILQANPPRVWISDADGVLRPVTENDTDLVEAEFIEGGEDAVLAWCVEGAGKGSPYAARVAIQQFAARGQADHVWINDAELDYLRLFAGGDDAAQAVFAPLDSEQAAAFFATRADEAAERKEAAAVAESRLEEPAAPDADGDEERDTPTPPEGDVDEHNALAEAEAAAARAFQAMLDAHVAAAPHSIPDALEAGRIFFEMGDINQSEHMYEHAIQGEDIDTLLEVAERHAEIKAGAARDLGIALYLHNLVRAQEPSADQTDVHARLAGLHAAFLDEAWIQCDPPERARHSVFPDRKIYENEPLVFIPYDEDGLNVLLEHRRTSLDAAAEAALRLAQGKGCEADLPEAFRMLSNLLLDRRQMAPRGQTRAQEPDRDLARDYTEDALAMDSPKREELQREWDRLAALVVEIRTFKNSDAEYRMQGYSGTWTFTARNVPANLEAYRRDLREGKLRHEEARRAANG